MVVGDVECPWVSSFYFDGKIDDLFAWVRIHLRHTVSDYANHDMLSFYPIDFNFLSFDKRLCG